MIAGHAGDTGRGDRGRVHGRAPRTDLRGLADVELVAVCDVRETAARELAERTGAAAYSDFAELLRRVDLDAVSVCTPDGLHREPCERALAGGRHVLVEKPIATTVEDAEAIVAAAHRAGVVLLVGHCLRFDPRYDQARQAVARGELGPIPDDLHAASQHGGGPGPPRGAVHAPALPGGPRLRRDALARRQRGGAGHGRVEVGPAPGARFSGGGRQLRPSPVRERGPRHRGAQLDPAPGLSGGRRPPAGPRGEPGLAVDRDARDRAPPRGRPARDPGGYGLGAVGAGLRAACSTSSCATSSTACAGGRRPRARRTTRSGRSGSPLPSSAPRRQAWPSPLRVGARAGASSGGIKQELRAAEQRDRAARRLVADARVPDLGGSAPVDLGGLAGDRPLTRTVPRKLAFSSMVVNPCAPSGRLARCRSRTTCRPAR